MRRQIAVLVVGLLVLPHVVSAQTLTPGTRVRFTHPGEGTRTGTVVALTPDTLEVRLSDRADAAHLPLDQVTRLEVSRGMARQPLRRAGIGFAVGAAVGAAGVAASEAGSDCDESGGRICLGAGGGALLGGIFYGAVGGVLGLVVGVIPYEKWERVTLVERRISLVAPRGSHGQGVGLRLEF
jgi:hypothetical protein